jgi:hypothetical protein
LVQYWTALLKKRLIQEQELNYERVKGCFIA